MWVLLTHRSKTHKGKELMLYIESLFNKALEVVAKEANSTVSAVKICYEFDLYDTMARVREVYTELYNGNDLTEEAVVLEDVEVVEVSIEQAFESKEEAEKEIEKKVYSVAGGWVKHRNLRKKLVAAHNRFLFEAICALDLKLSQ
jgi:hypothetical protein